VTTTTTTTLPRRRLASRKHRRTALIRTVVRHVLIIGGLVMLIYPLIWMFLSSFRPSKEIISSTQLWPGDSFTTENYTNGWLGVGAESFSTFFLNSFVIAGLSVVGNVIACSVAAYAFAKLEFPGKRILFAIMIGTLMLPYHVQLIPQYVLFSQLGWVNTVLPLVVPKFLATDAFFVFLLVQFIRGLPNELMESARLDGCGHLRTFLQILVPLSLPALGTTAVFTFIWSWNDFLTPLIYLTEPDKYTVPIGLRLFLDSTGESSYGGLFAMSVLSLIPLLGFFLAFQRTLVRGIATTGLK